MIDLAAISNDPSGEHFEDATWEINHAARARCARLARAGGVSRYVLPSTCSVYGFQSADFIADETSDTNPLTTYAKANLPLRMTCCPWSTTNSAQWSCDRPPFMGCLHA